MPLGFFGTVFYQPLYNGLVFLLGFVPGGDVGVTIIFFTIIVKLALFPLSAKAIDAQRKMKELEPEMARIKEQYKDNKEEQSRKTMQLYKEKNMNPFSGIIVVIIQLPIIFALYKVFYAGGFPTIQTDLLYSFVNHTPDVSTLFLGILDITKKSIPLALLAGITQFAQAHFSFQNKKSPTTAATPAKGSSFQADFANSMQLQMKYFFPVFITFIAWSISGAVALYWVTNNVFTLLQEMYVKYRTIAKESPSGLIR